ncbi:MAG TPA: hypothetical protein VGD17_05655 [Chitinophagaceae bacterium]
MKKRFYQFLSAPSLAYLICINALISCGSNENPATGTESTTTQQNAVSKTTNACDLLTESDARNVLGNAITPGMQTETMCQYVSAAEELSKTGENVSLTLHRNSASEYDKYLADTETSTGIKPEPVSGIGQKAAWADGSLIVQHGNDLLIIIVGQKLDKEKHISVARSLATVIISRM